ncbi:MAG: hypothetical protein ACPGRD_09695, partial [Planktomarina sp.]
RCYRLNSNYAKPSVVGEPIRYIAGGHGGNHKTFDLDPNLYNFHLRFIDYEMSMARLDKSLKRRLDGRTAEEITQMTSGGWGWNKAAQTFDSLSTRLPVEETVAHVDFRKKMLTNKIDRPPFTLMGGGRPHDNYKLPERFSGIF